MDLFSGPGGLAEGFAALRSPGGRRRFRIELSIEMDRAAHRTLLLRAFLRQFGTRFPSEYYDFLNGMKEEPDWAELYPKHWATARDETRCLELGTPDADDFLQRRISQIRAKHRGRTVLLGGPPCQSYSIAGRSRNAGNSEYRPEKDHRQSLYEQYVQVLRKLRPAIAVMENVKGMLSAQQNGKPIFPQVMDSLRHSSGKDGYRLFALHSSSKGQSWDEGLTPKDFLLHAEDYGIPQSRHRVFIIGVRRDLAKALPDGCLPKLEPWTGTVSVKEIIGSMPKLRSRLSRDDDARSWQRAVREACTLVKANRPKMSRKEAKQFRKAIARAQATATGRAPPCAKARGKVRLPARCPSRIGEWILDEDLKVLPNNETRAHMAPDLSRYLFAAAFARTFGRSPKSSDFPEELAPDHTSWNTGNFDDRYRVQIGDQPSTTVTSHIAKDGHYFIHPDPGQCRSLTVREVARLQTFPDNYFFHGSRSQQYVQVGNAVPPLLAYQIAKILWSVLDNHERVRR